jgi:hypothetical protein
MSVDDLDHGTANIPIHFFARGKVIKRWQTCGKMDCACRKGGKFLHGPYFYLVITNPVHDRSPDEPKQKWFYLTEEEADRLKLRIRNFNLLAHNLYSDIIDQMKAGSG